MMKLARFLALLLTMVLVLLFFYLSPIYKTLECLQGAYNIGVQFHYIKDETRKINDKSRELMLTVWYPTSIHATGKMFYPLAQNMPIFKNEIQSKIPLPDFVIKRLLNVKSCSIIDAPIAPDQKFPLIIFCAGCAGDPVNYNRYIESIVKNGYIVVGISHSFVSPEGIIKYEMAADVLTNSGESFKELNDQVKDVIFTLDQVIELNKSDTILKGSIDLEKIACMGHSFGGAVALAAARQDKRCTAAINLDGSLTFDPHGEQPIEKPVLNLLSDYERESFLSQRLKNVDTSKAEYLAYKYSSFFKLRKKIHDPVYTMVIKKSGHDSFSDYIFLKYPLAKIFHIDSGEADCYKIFYKINTISVQFLDTYLKRSATFLETFSNLYYLDID